MGLKLHRYHMDIYCPEWFDVAIDDFNAIVSDKQLICSYHATKKYKSFSRVYKKAILNLLDSIDIRTCVEYVFEFYANDKNEIKKVCYRFPMREALESDIIFVISSTGKVVTMFLNRNFDPHVSLDINLYEKGDKNVVQS